MSNNTNNSLSTLISQFLKLETNALETFNKLNEAITSNKQTVDVDLFDQSNNLVRIQIPSFGFLKNEINRLDTNLQNLAGTGDSDTNVRLADGTYRKVITSKLKTAGNTLTEVAVPTNFNTKSNWFFEEFMNPLLYITINVTSQIPVDTERIITKRYILTLDTEKKLQYFNDTYKGKDGINYSDFLNDMLAHNISFILDEETQEVPPRKLRYIGNFSVLKIRNKQTDTLVDGQTISNRQQIYKLNKLTYTDLNSNFTDSISLKIGDSMIVNNDRKNTRYTVKSVDSTTNEVSLELVEGFDAINIGSDVIGIYRGQDENIQLEIPIGFDENVVTFIKSVDPISKIPSELWSPGIAFYTNELEILKTDGQVQTLETYYKNEVADIGGILLGLAKDKMPPALYAATPNIPDTTASDFQVVQINKHLTDNDTFKEIQQSNDEKNKLIANIKETDVAIGNKRALISTKKYDSTIEKQVDLKELQSLIERRANSSKLYSSIVNNIVDKAKGNSLTGISPKYRVRGFWPIPEPKSSPYTNPQEIVQFAVQYRYLSTTGKPNNVEQIIFADNSDVERRGTFSNWVEIRTNSRERIENEINGQFEWTVQNTESAENININQLDIPIQANESVEIKIKAISEAGWPANPKESEWSESIIVDFPDDKTQDNDLETIKEENSIELAKVQLLEQLNSMGIDEHLSSSFTANEYYFAHDATKIASGFLSQEQKPINLFDKLVEFENRINYLQEIIDKVTGELVVKILDDTGAETLIENNSANKFFAGYYLDEVKDRDIKKGSIVTKTYFVTIENKVATPLEIISRMPGNRNTKLPMSSTLFGDTGPDVSIASDSYYTTRGKYDRVPLLYINPSNSATGLGTYVLNTPYQSAQKYGQFLYGRWKNIAGNEDFYLDTDTDTDYTTIITSMNQAEYSLVTPIVSTSTPGFSNTSDYIWTGYYTGVEPNVASLTNVTNVHYNDNILVHWLHPNVNDGAGLYTLTKGKVDFRNAKHAVNTNNTTNGKKQCGYFYDSAAEYHDETGTLVTGRSVKTSFQPDDQYLLGGKSCGSYLFVAVNDEESLLVNGDDALSSIKIVIGQNNAIQIPLIYQYRMTDFAGVGTDGIGFIAGDSTNATKDITYSKKIGLDLKVIDETMHKLDIEIYAKYRSNNLNIDKIPRRDIRLAVEDLRQTLKGSVVPNITERPTKDVSGIK
jgi:hypothetical protein